MNHQHSYRDTQWPTGLRLTLHEWYKREIEYMTRFLSSEDIIRFEQEVIRVTNYIVGRGDGITPYTRLVMKALGPEWIEKTKYDSQKNVFYL